MQGKYAREYALTCNPYDKWRFRNLAHGIIMRHRQIWVRKVKIGDIITSRGKIIRWKIVEDNETGDLYLGFIEEVDRASGHRHGKVSMYVFGWDGREHTSQDFVLIRLKTSNLDDIVIPLFD